MKLAGDNILQYLNLVNLSADENISIMSNLNSKNSQAVVFSFISMKENVDSLPYNTQKELLLKEFQSDKNFENGELLDTLEKRALYPIIHCSTKPVNEIDDAEPLNINSLGDLFFIRQGIYIESKSHQTKVQLTNENAKKDIAYIFMGFKSLDLTFSETLENSWKEWTGARQVNTRLRKEFHISRYSFFHRIAPPNPELFMYILLIECHNVNNTNKTYLLDFVQRLRVERVFGYITIYKRDVLPSTSAIIKTILNEPDEFVSKVDV